LAWEKPRPNFVEILVLNSVFGGDALRVVNLKHLCEEIEASLVDQVLVPRAHELVPVFLREV